MDNPSPPSSNDSMSRRGSHVNTHLYGIPSHPEHVNLELRRESVYPLMSLDGANQTSLARPQGAPGRFRPSPDIVSPVDDDGLDEHSPLLSGRELEDSEPLSPLPPVLSPTGSSDDCAANVREDSTERSKSSWYLFLLTLSIGGLQIAWSVELSNGSPYLLSLGISKSFLALVWIAGPLSGTLVQPYVGIKSDQCRSRFGKRRPFMVGGAIATIASMMALAWAKELTGAILHVFGVSKGSRADTTTAIVFAVIMIYVLDFAINVIQAGIRAFIVDNAPTHQQDSANAWASRLSGVGNIIGYLFGYADLPRYLWFFGDTQFKVLCVIASIAMIVTVAISCATIHERDPRLDDASEQQANGILALFKSLWRSVRKLPRQISRVCQVQFFAWIGWFPFLFYITTYIGEIYVEPFFEANPHMTTEEIDETWQRATRVGTFALFMFAITTFAASVLLPFIVASSYKAHEPPLRTPMTPGAAKPANDVTSAASANGLWEESLPQADGSMKPVSPSIFARYSSRIPSLEIPWLTLRRAWMLSHILFFILTWLTFAVRTTLSATILAAFVGVPWAMTNWAPFALIAADISRRDALRRGILRPSHHASEHEDNDSDNNDQAGVILGIHNVAIAAPQVIATLVSSAIFSALQKPRGSVGDDSVAWVLRFGGAAALVAAWFTRRVDEEGKRRT